MNFFILGGFFRVDFPPLTFFPARTDKKNKQIFEASAKSAFDSHPCSFCSGGGAWRGQFSLFNSIPTLLPCKWPFGQERPPDSGPILSCCFAPPSARNFRAIFSQFSRFFPSSLGIFVRFHQMCLINFCQLYLV